MTRDEFKKQLQDHFSDGLVTIIGSGLSCAEGIPGMGALANYLLVEMPKVLDSSGLTNWQPISDLLNSGSDLESAMMKHPPNTDVETKIVNLTTSFIGLSEARVLEEVFSGSRTLRLTKLFRHIVKPPSGIPVITTNYERLVEVAAEAAGLGVDTSFVGSTYGRHDVKESRLSFCREVTVSKNRATFHYADRVNLSKPHGSLDWYQHKNEPIRCSIPLALPRLVITPGRNKFRSGYERPFDRHRERANHDIDRAARFLIVGYGFNDDHLETHLAARIREGTPTLVLTHSLSKNGELLLRESPGMTVLTADAAPGAGAIVHTKTEVWPFVGTNIWDLGAFISEIFLP